MPLSVKEGGKLGLVHVFPTLFTAAGGLKQMPAPNTLLNQACAEPRCYTDPSAVNAGWKTNRSMHQVCSSRLCLPASLLPFLPSVPPAHLFPSACPASPLRKLPSAGHGLLLQNSSCVKGDLFFLRLLFFIPQ